MCKCNCESVDHLFLHCPVALELWNMVFGLFGVYQVMPLSVVGLFACWQGRFGHHRNGDIWMVVPHCLLWCIWKERNSKCFEDIELSMSDISSYFSELYWTCSLCGGTILFLLFWIYLIFVMFVLDLFTLVYSLCTWVSLSFYYQWIFITYQKKKNVQYAWCRSKPAYWAGQAGQKDYLSISLSAMPKLICYINHISN